MTRDTKHVLVCALWVFVIVNLVWAIAYVQVNARRDGKSAVVDRPKVQVVDPFGN